MAIIVIIMEKLESEPVDDSRACVQIFNHPLVSEVLIWYMIDVHSLLFVLFIWILDRDFNLLMILGQSHFRVICTMQHQIR